MPNRPAEAEHIRHCPRCAAPSLSWLSEKNFRCSACGFTLFLNVAAAVGVIMECQGKLLFGVRKNDPGKGMLDLPGGFVDPEENAEECARREVREETGIDIPPASYFMSLPNSYHYRDITYSTLDLVYTVSFDQPPPMRAADDLIDLLWILRGKIDLDSIAFPSLREAVRRYLLQPTAPLV
ncbi:NUDIX domain-containing protein [Geotalea sp. SG265]|uniref:NUDIX hydrolase n=1 Tax=Geotalea sp. SG265 TaxID=2922867 RepID=UPI001FAFD7CF|nr:NUDIX domain-containing protein [Geotalea sp. SG265]